MAEKSRNGQAISDPKPAKPPELPVDVFDQGIRLLQNSGLPGVDDETLVVWYAIIRHVPVAVFTEAVRMILSGQLKPADFSSAVERSIPNLICQYHESQKEARARAARLARQDRERQEFKAMQRVDVADVKQFCRELRAK